MWYRFYFERLRFKIQIYLRLFGEQEVGFILEYYSQEKLKSFLEKLFILMKSKLWNKQQIRVIVYKYR